MTVDRILPVIIKGTCTLLSLMIFGKVQQKIFEFIMEDEKDDKKEKVAS